MPHVRWLIGLAPTLLFLGACSDAHPGVRAAVYAEPDAVEVDGEHYVVEFENERVRVLRVTFPPGHRSPQHRHPEYCAVFLTPATWRFTDSEGAVTRAESEPGAVGCVPPEIHSPENVGSDPAELILIELKEDGA